tara:strand:- start:170 stop:616 length:447 start_codon:yes stop_codon:yes gene_type:complete
MIRVRIQYRDMTEKQCKKFWQDYPEEASSGHKWTDPEILDAVWEQWNNGSGKECDLFKKLEVRSMMVGDYVHILRRDKTGVWHECLAIGWRINVPWEEVLGNAEKKDFSDVSKEDVSKALVNMLENQRWEENISKVNIPEDDHVVRAE